LTIWDAPPRNGPSPLSRWPAKSQKKKMPPVSASTINGKRRCRRTLSAAIISTVTTAIVNMLCLIRLRSASDMTSIAWVTVKGRSSTEKCSSKRRRGHAVRRTSMFKNGLMLASPINTIIHDQETSGFLKKWVTTHHAAHQNTAARTAHTTTEIEYVAG